MEFLEGENEESNILVAIRVRPLLPKEQLKKHFETLRVEDNLIIAFDPVDIKMEQERKQKLDIYHRSREQ